MPAMNLLHYPALDRQRRWRHRWRTFVAGTVAGLGLAWSGVQWTVSQAPELQQAHGQIQASLQTQKQQRQHVQQEKAEHAVRQQQVGHLQQVAQQHKAWSVLHQALLHEARDGSLQLLSLQLVQERLELHGRAHSLQSMNQARQRIAQDLGVGLELSSAVLAPIAHDANQPDTLRRVQQATPTVEFVWHAGWPAIRSRAVPVTGVAQGAVAASSVP